MTTEHRDIRRPHPDDEVPIPIGDEIEHDDAVEKIVEAIEKAVEEEHDD